MALRTTKLAVFLLLIGSSAQAAESNWDSSSPRRPVLRLTFQAGTTTAVGARITTTEQRGSQIRSREFSCFLLEGAASRVLTCGGIADIPVEIQYVDPTRRSVEVVLSEVFDQALAAGWSITNLSAGDPPAVIAQPAEAYWIGLGPFGMWVCFLEQRDVDRCNNFCGGWWNVEDLDTETHGPVNPSVEPSCDTTCTCLDGSELIHYDPPQIEPM